MSFFSPCILPLFPVYLTTISSSSLEKQYPALINTLIFVFSFCLIFVLLGLSATSLGIFLNINKIFLIKAAGILIILFGIFNLEIIKLNSLYKTFQPNFYSSNIYLKPIILGLSFGIAWTPCVGPILASIITYSSIEKNYEYSFFVLSFYSLGLGLPFVIGTLGYDRIISSIKKYTIFGRYFNKISGTILIVFGLLVYFNKIYLLTVYIQKILNIFN
tara:strand:- start:10326 stop:10976 length:651 start_codon:yes stop_codon:yes gene_type:complete